MTDLYDEDKIFERVAKNLAIIRRSSGPAQSNDLASIAASLARAEAELRTMSSSIEALRARSERQHAACVRLEEAAEKREADLNALSRKVLAISTELDRQQAEKSPALSTRARRPRALLRVVFASVILGAGIGVMVWFADHQRITLSVMQHWFGAVLAQPAQLYSRGHAGAGRPDRNPAGATAGSVSLPGPSQSTEPDSSDPMDSATLHPEAADLVSQPADPQLVSSQEPNNAASATVQGPDATLGSRPTAETVLAELPTAMEPLSTQAPAPLPPPPLESTDLSLQLPPTVPAGEEPAGSPEPKSALPGSSLPRPEPRRQIVLRALADTWVQVRTQDGRMLLQRIMKKGEAWPAPHGARLLLDTGYADGLELEVTGVPTRLTGAKGGVIRNVVLDADLLTSGAVRASR